MANIDLKDYGKWQRRGGRTGIYSKFTKAQIKKMREKLGWDRDTGFKAEDIK